LEQVPSIALNPLAVENSRWHEQKALASYQQVKLAQVPTIAFFASLTRQQFNTEPALFASNVRWIPSSYIGVKLVWSSPSANTLSQLFKAKYDYRLAQQNTAKVELQAGLQAQKLNVDHAKAVSQWKTNRQVYELNRDTYQKNLNLYRDGILSLDQTLTSFNTMTNSEYNLISSSVNILLAKSKIYLNNLEK
nr:TolC family protein [Bernardetiaceae bacterium]